MISLPSSLDEGRRKMVRRVGDVLLRSQSRRSVPAITTMLAAHSAARSLAIAITQHRGRHDMRTWQIGRRKRMKHLIEHGCLAVKAHIGASIDRYLWRAHLDGKKALN